MHMYIILLLILIILSVISFFVNNKDVMSPSFISCIAYTLCNVCAMLGRYTWNNVIISWKLIGIITLGLLMFIIGEIIVRRIYKKKAKKEEKITEEDIIKIKQWKIIFSIVFIAMEVLLMFLEIRRIALAAGFDDDNILKMFSFYREKSQLFSTELVKKGLKINLIVSQINKLCNVLGIIYIFPIILCCVLALMTGSRTQIIKYIIAFFMIGFIIYSQKRPLKQLLKKMLIIGSLLIIIVLPIFYGTLPLLGRVQDKSFFTYITFYLGTSIPSFENYLNNPPIKSEQFGEETLRGINSFLNKIGIIDNITPVSREWTHFPGSNHSNVYTAFRRYMQDFGIIGVIICQFLFGVTFSGMYLLARNRKNGIALIYYNIYSYMLIDQVRDELFFTTFVHINLFINIILVFLSYWILVKFDFNDVAIYKEKFMKILKNERKENANKE